jgi:ribosomal subunit interface protein
MPTINFKLNNLDQTDQLQALVEQKFTAFEKYWAPDIAVVCDVEFKKEAPQQTGEVFTVAANLSVAGTLYRASATMESFEQAIDEVRDELDKELRRAKDKADTLEKKGGRELKEQMLDS